MSNMWIRKRIESVERELLGNGRIFVISEQEDGKVLHQEINGNGFPTNKYYNSLNEFRTMLNVSKNDFLIILKVVDNGQVDNSSNKE